MNDVNELNVLIVFKLRSNHLFYSGVEVMFLEMRRRGLKVCKVPRGMKAARDCGDMCRKKYFVHSFKRIDILQP